MNDHLKPLQEMQFLYALVNPNGKAEKHIFMTQKDAETNNKILEQNPASKNWSWEKIKN